MNFLPGWNPGFIAAAVAAPPEVTLTTTLSATSTSATINAPNGINPGDLIILLDWAQNSDETLPTSVVPSAFTSISNQTGAAGLAGWRSIVSYRLADGGEDNDPFVGMNGETSESKIMVVFRFSSPIVGVSISAVSSSGFQTGNPAAQTTLSGAGTPPLLVLATYQSTGAVNPRTFTVGGVGAKDGEETITGNADYIAWKMYGASPANVVADMDDEGTINIVRAFFITLTV